MSGLFSIVILNEVKDLDPSTEDIRLSSVEALKAGILRGVYTERSECAQNDQFFMVESVEIIPAVIPKSLEELKAAIKIVEPHCAWLHVDVMDGVFVPNTTIQNPLELHQLETKLKLEAHLMVLAKPEVRNAWFDSPAERLIWHIEAFDSPEEAERTVESTKAIGKEIGLALNPETPLSAIEPYLDKLDTVLVMSVKPGFAGQQFDESVIPKIQSLRQKWPSGIISVDGGIRVGTARQVVAAGARRLIAGSALFGAEDFGEALRLLREDIEMGRS